MIRLTTPTCGDAPARLRRSRPAVEGLESRMLLYGTTGGAWAETARITFSFAPDGTDVGGSPSSLHATMAANGLSTTDWQNAIRRAAAVWSQIAGIDFAEVPDDGSPLGIYGHQQNDPRFGDIRIVAAPMTSGTLGLAFSPPPFNGGTLAGDIVLNSNVAWRNNSAFDVQTVAIHEIGHSLGMGHATISQAVMFASYTSVKQALHPDDRAGAQSIYGARPHDFIDVMAPNNTPQTAININGLINSLGQIRLGGVEINSSSDFDWYYVATPATHSGRIAVTMQATGLSLLTPRIQIYSTTAQLLADNIATNMFGGTAFATAPASTNQGFLIRAHVGAAGPTSAGAYGLLVNFGSAPIAPIAPPNTTVPWQPSQGGGSHNLDAGTSRFFPPGLDRAPGLSREPGQSKGEGVEPPDLIRLGELVGFGDLSTTQAGQKLREHGGGVIDIGMTPSHPAPALGLGASRFRFPQAAQRVAARPTFLAAAEGFAGLVAARPPRRFWLPGGPLAPRR